MGTTLTATFETRREAEMTVERLVQEHGIERTDRRCQSKCTACVEGEFLPREPAHQQARVNRFGDRPSDFAALTAVRQCVGAVENSVSDRPISAGALRLTAPDVVVTSNLTTIRSTSAVSRANSVLIESQDNCCDRPDGRSDRG